MRDFAAFCTLLAFLIVLVASIIALVRPLPKVGLGTRKRALGGLGVAVALFILTAIVIPAPDVKSEAGMPATPAQPTTNPPAGANVELSPQQDRVVDFIRYVVMQNINCGGSSDLTQDQLDKLASNRARPIDAYEEAKRGIENCSDTLAEYARTDVLDGIASEQRSIAADAVKSCSEAAKERKSGMQLAQQVLDGDGRLASASKYREMRDTAKMHETSCRMSLLGLAERMKIPESEVEFAKL